MAFLFFLPLFAVALMATRVGRGGGRGGGGGRGRGGGGRGRGRAPREALRGRVWDRDGDHAIHILRGYLAGDPNFADWRAFKQSHSSWILSPSNLTGYYLIDNLRRNFNATIERYERFQNPDDDFDANYPPGFLAAAGAPGIPQNNPDGLNFAPRSDHEGDDDPDFADLPPQFANPPSVINVDPQGVGHRSVAGSLHSVNRNLEEQLDGIINQVAGMNMNPNQSVIDTFAFRAQGVRIRGARSDDVNNVLGVVAPLNSGTHLPSLSITLEDRTNYTMTAHADESMGRASRVIPSSTLFSRNPEIYQVLRQAIQGRLNLMDRNDEGFLTMQGRGTLPGRAASDQAAPLESLYLADPGDDEIFLLHSVPLSDEESNTPAAVAIVFFIEDMGNKQTTHRKKSNRKMPAKGPQPPTPPSPNKRRRDDDDGDDDDDDDNMFGTPDAATSGGGFFGCM